MIVKITIKFKEYNSCIQEYENYEYTDWTDIETAVDISNFYNDFCEKNENRYAYFQLFNVEKL